MQETTAVTTLPRRTEAAGSSRRFALLTARLSAALLAGSLAVVGPWALDMVVGRALAAKASRVLSSRTGLSVRIQRVRPRGLLSPGLLAEGVQFLDPDLSVNTDRITITWSPFHTKILVDSPVLTGDAAALGRAARRFLGRRRLRGRASSTSRLHPRPSPFASLSNHTQLEVRRARALVSFHHGRSGRVILAARHLRLNRSATAISLVGSLTARLDGPDGSRALLQVDHMRVRPDRFLSWLSRNPSGKLAEIRRALASAGSPDLDWIDDARGRIAVSLSPAAIRRTLACGETCRMATMAGRFNVETLAPGLTGAEILVQDAEGLGVVQAQATRDRLEDKWRIEVSFQDLPGRIAARFLPGIRVTQGRLDGKMGLRAHRGKWHGDVRLSFDGNLDMRHRLLAGTTVSWKGLDIELDAGLNKSRTGWTARIRRASLASKQARLNLRGRISVESGRAWYASLSVSLPMSPCQAILDALPPTLVPVLEGMKLQGALAGRLHFEADSRHLENLVADLKTKGNCRVLEDAPAADPHRLLQGPVHMKGWDAQGHRMDIILGHQNRFYRPLNALPRHLVRAFLVTEDRKFFRHRGFDWEQIRKALAFDIQHKAVIKGASSISQQVVKNLYLTQRRTLARKLQEAVLTWRMEQVVPKRRILELYLNLVEMGPGLYGVARGARTYFGKRIGLLTPLESLHLASITPAPRYYYHVFKEKGRVGMAWLERLRHRLNWMYRSGWISKPDYVRLQKGEFFLAAF